MLELEIFEIPELDGKVCYLDDSGKIPTIECYSRSIAFRFNTAKLFPIKIGEWIRFRGKVSIGTEVLKNGKIKGVEPYRHEPRDESPREHWLFFELTEARYRRIGPLDAMDILRKCSNFCRRFIDSWETNDNVEQLQKLRESLLDTLDVIQPILRQRIIDEKERRAPIIQTEFRCYD